MARYGADYSLWNQDYDVDYDARGVPADRPEAARRRDFFRGGDGDYGTSRRLHGRRGHPARGRYRGRRSGDIYGPGRRYVGWHMGTRSDWSHETEPEYEDRLFGRFRSSRPPRPESRGYDRGW